MTTESNSSYRETYQPFCLTSFNKYQLFGKNPSSQIGYYDEAVSEPIVRGDLQ